MKEERRYIEKELESMASSLAGYKGDNNIPIDYFDKMQSSVLAKVEQADIMPIRISHGNKIWVWIGRVAAMALILIVVGIGLLNISPDNDGYAGITDNEIIAYILEEYDDLDLINDLEYSLNTEELNDWTEEDENIFDEFLLDSELDELL